jgi:hypothetical protein
MSAFAIYIPCVYTNITEEMIAQTFYRKKIGSVRHVDLVKHTDKYNHAHVFFESMYPFGQGAKQMDQIANGDTVKLQYSRNQYVFWLMMKNHRKYDGVSKKGWYDVDAKDAKKEAAAADDKETSHKDPHTMFIDSMHESDDMGDMNDQINKEIDEMDQEMNNENPESFSLVSVEYVHSLEAEIARLHTHRNDDTTMKNEYFANTLDDGHLADLHSEIYKLRWAYYNLIRAKIPPHGNIGNVTPPMIEHVSNYEGYSEEFDKVVCDEIARLNKDNDNLVQNNNVLSCMPNVTDCEYDTTATDCEIYAATMTRMVYGFTPPSPGLCSPISEDEQSSNPDDHLGFGFDHKQNNADVIDLPFCDCPIQ